MISFHTDLAAVDWIYLGTDDATGFYKKLGFAPQRQGMSLIVGRYLDNDTR